MIKQITRSRQIVMMNRGIFILSLLGIVIAIYVLQSFIRQTPIVCVNTGCELVRKNAASYLFGIPVPVFGLVGYSFIAVLSFLRTMENGKKEIFLKGILAVSTFGVGFVAWFTYTEIFIIRAICTWCAISAGNMLIIFTLSLFSYTWKKNKL